MFIISNKWRFFVYFEVIFVQQRSVLWLVNNLLFVVQPHRCTLVTLRRLRPMHRLYRQVHLFVRGRAPWPTTQLGPAPKDDKERQMVWMFCTVNHQGNKIKLSPKSALAEYEAWWNGTRPKRTMNVQQRGNIYLGRARKLRARLGQISPKDQLAQRLLKLIWDFDLKSWPEALSDHTPQSQVEKDTFFDWLFASERQIRRYLPSEYYGPKYHYWSLVNDQYWSNNAVCWWNIDIPICLTQTN